MCLYYICLHDSYDLYTRFALLESQKQKQMIMFQMMFLLQKVASSDLSSMAYRVNGLPPFQVSFSITFPEGYVGKEKLDTKFQVEAENSQVQATWPEFFGVFLSPSSSCFNIDF